MTAQVLVQPTIRIIGRSQIDHDLVEEFLDEEGTYWVTEDPGTGTELIAELAGRVCYMSFGEKQGRRSTREYLNNIIGSHHGSVLEHVSWSFLITGVSRSFTHELIRHRAGTAVSQLSQRYVDASDTKFVMPPLLYQMLNANPDTVSDAEALWGKAMDHALKTYEQLNEMFEGFLATTQPDMPKRMRRKRAREAARSVLPNATETKLVFTANARALRHIIELRGSPDAEAEIRTFAVLLAALMKREAPMLFDDVCVAYDPSGTLSVRTEHPKV